MRRTLILSMLTLTALVAPAVADDVNDLLMDLKYGTTYVREGAASSLGWIGDESAIAPLIKALQKDDSLEVRESAAYALGRIGDQRAVDPLINVLKDEGSLVQGAAAWALGEINDTKAIDALIEVLKDEDADVRAEAARALGKIRDPQAVNPLIDTLEDQHWEVRANSAWALGNFDDVQSVDPLISALKDENADVRNSAAESLGLIGDQRAVYPLIDALKDEVADVRAEAAYALGNIGDKRAIYPLIEILEDEHPRVQQAAAYALEILMPTTTNVVEEFISDLKHGNSDVSRNAAAALIKIGKLAVNPLIETLNDENSAARGAAAQALGNIGDKRAIYPLIDALEDDSWVVRANAAQALGKIGSPKNSGLIGMWIDPTDVDYWITQNVDGMNTVVIIMDISGSTRREMSVGGTTFLEYEKALAIEILKSPEFRDDRVALVVFGTEAFFVFTPRPIAGKEIMIQDRISSLSFLTGVQEETHLDTGLALAWAILNSSSGEREVIVISDGRVKEYPDTFVEATRMIQEMEATVHLVEVKSFADALGGFSELAAKTGAEYHLALYPGSVSIGGLDNVDNISEIAYMEGPAFTEGAPGAVDSLIEALKDENPTVRSNAAFALGSIGDPNAVDFLILALKDEDHEVREWAAIALSWIGGDRVIDLLITSLKDKDANVRSGAAKALGEIGDERALDPLIMALKDEDANVHMAAADALGNFVRGITLGDAPSSYASTSGASGSPADDTTSDDIRETFEGDVPPPTALLAELEEDEDGQAL